jgi:hypothetical protein
MKRQAWSTREGSTRCRKVNQDHTHARVERTVFCNSCVYTYYNICLVFMSAETGLDTMSFKYHPVGPPGDSVTRRRVLRVTTQAVGTQKILFNLSKTFFTRCLSCIRWYHPTALVIRTWGHVDVQCALGTGERGTTKTASTCQCD